MFRVERRDFAASPAGPKDEAGALRLTQVIQLASRDEILKLKDNLEHLLASGVKDSDLKDGSVPVGRIYCCHQ